MSSGPFDPDSPCWVIKNALVLAKVIGVPIKQVVNTVAPKKK
jgi:hypothetical protein